MNRLQSLRRRPRVLRDAQPHRGDRPRARSSARSPTRTRSSRPTAHARAGAATREISGREPHALLRRLLGLGLPRGRRRQRAARRDGASEARAVTRERALRGHDPPPPLRGARARVPPPRSRWPTSTSTSCRGCSAAGSSRARPGSCASAARDYLGDPAVPLADAVRALVARADRARPDGPDPAAHPACARSATASTRSASTTASTRDGRALEARRRRGDEHAVGRAPRLRARRRRRRRADGDVDKALHVSPFMGMDHALRRARDRARRRRCRCTSRADATASAAFDATLALRRRAAHARARWRRSPRATRRDAAHAGADLRATRVRAEAQGRARPSRIPTAAAMIATRRPPHRPRACCAGIRVGQLTVVEGRRPATCSAPARPQATVVVRSPRVWPALLRGGRGLAEAYVDGLWDSPDLDRGDRASPRATSTRIDRLRRRLAPVREPFQRARAAFARNTPRAARARHRRPLRPRQRPVRADARRDDDVLVRGLRAPRR